MRYLIAFLCFLSLPAYAAQPQGPTLKQVITRQSPLSRNPDLFQQLATLRGQHVVG